MANNPTCPTSSSICSWLRRTSGREKVFYEINRPTFARLKPPLPKICRFIPYSELKNEVEQIGSRMRYMKPEFISEIAESCEPDYS
ncbi:MAG TPA: hypothetical protein PKV33_11780 [Methanothrix sp.]|nr:hypothetical protein [Methanothrix sp.]